MSSYRAWRTHPRSAASSSTPAHVDETRHAIGASPASIPSVTAATVLALRFAPAAVYSRSFLSKYAFITSRTMGAANCPCSPCSNSATTTISGARAAQSPRTRRCPSCPCPHCLPLRKSFEASCAVPVLPQTSMSRQSPRARRCRLRSPRRTCRRSRPSTCSGLSVHSVGLSLV